MPLNKGNNHIAIIRDRGFADHHDIPIIDARLDHGIPPYLQRKVLALGRQHRGRYSDLMRNLVDCLDRDTGSDTAHHRQFHRCNGCSGRRGALICGGGCLGHVLDRATQTVRKANDLNRAGAMGEAADKAPLLQRGDQPVDPRF